MSSGQKVAFSLLISVLAFCAFTVVAFSGLFDLLEVNFYQPIVQEIKQKKIEEIAAAQNEYFDILMKRFDAFSVSQAVKSYADTHPSDAATKNREILRSRLVTSTAALTGIRIISDNGRNVFFSTFQSDIISGKNGITYRNYDSSGEISFDSVSSKKLVEGSSPSDLKCRIIKDGSGGRLIYSFPFYNLSNEYTGTILFYCDAQNFSQFLYNRNLIDIKGFATLVTDSPNSRRELEGFGGFVFGMPNYGQSSVQTEILNKWRTGGENFWKLTPAENSTKNDPMEILDKSKSHSLCAFSYKNSREDFGFITLLYDEGELKFPPYIRILLLATAFVTLYLAIFLILSFKHDDIVIIRDRIRRYENEFFIGYKNLGDGRSPEYLAEQKPVLERRILHSLGKKGEKHAAEFKAIFENYWQEMLVSFGENPVLAIGSAAASQINADELKKIVRSSLEDILENGKIQINAVQVSNEKTERLSEAKKTEVIEEIAAPEEISEAENLENVEEIAEIEEAPEAEELEDAEEVADAEELEDVEDVSEADELEDVEEVAETEELEDVEEVAETEELEEVETISEAEEFEDAGEVAEAEELEEVEEIPEAEELEDIEEAPEAEELENAEEVENVDDAEPVEEVSDVEDLEEIEEADELDDEEEIEELASANTEAIVSEDLEPISDMSEELRLGDGRVEDDDSDDTKFSTVTEDELKHKFEDELEMLPEVSEHEERAFEIAKTLEALPDEPPRWTDNDDVELDSEGLSRKLSYSEMHDIEKLRDAARSVDEMDTGLEELETIDVPNQPEEETELTPENFIPKLVSKPSYDEDDVYKDEALLEKIEFGVPSSEIFCDGSDDSVAENFKAFPVDYTSLDEDDSDEKLYEPVSYSDSDITENEHYFENPNLLKNEEISEENTEVSEENTEVSEDSAENQDTEFIADSREDAANVTDPLDDVEEVEALEKPEDNMPFMFTQFGSSCNTQIAELADMPDAIVQDSDGTFRVTEMPKTDAKLSLDMEFKKLVDSILY